MKEKLICDKAHECGCTDCLHGVPHETFNNCAGELVCLYKRMRCKCVPVTKGKHANKERMDQVDNSAIIREVDALVVWLQKEAECAEADFQNASRKADDARADCFAMRARMEAAKVAQHKAEATLARIIEAQKKEGDA